MQPPTDVMAIGIDVGGTKVRTAAVDGAGSVVARRERPVDRATTIETLLGGLVEDMAEVGRRVRAGVGRELPISIALPGLLDRSRGCVVRSINLPFLEAVPIVDLLGKRVGRRPVLLSDAEAATWGEYAATAPRPRNFVHLRLGTGVACGVVAQGELLCLDAERDAHLSVLVVDDGPTALECPCGLRGCLETVASGTALAERGDEPATAALDRAADGVACAVVNLCRRFDTSSVVLGGGVILHIPDLYDRAAAQLQRTQVRVERAALGEDAGVIGAALLALARS